MRITLIAPTAQTFRVHPYGARMVSASLRRSGHDVSMIFLPRDLGAVYSPDILEQVCELSASSDLIGLSFMTDDLENAVVITSALRRKSRAPVVWGGVHPTMRPQECLQYADLVCVGEGEDALVELAASMEAGRDFSRVDGLWCRAGDGARANPLRPLIHDLDRLPFPDYDPERHFVLDAGVIRPLAGELLQRCLSGTYLTLTTRGCPYSCSYCWNHAFGRIFPGGQRIRKRSVDHVISELSEVASRFPFLEVMCIDDDAFFLRSDEDIEDFAAQYKERVKIPMWVTGATPLSLTARKLEALAAAGMTAIRMGIQSGSSRTKKLYRRSHSNRSVLQAVRLIDNYRDRVTLRQYDIILDNPWETDADLRQTLLLLSRFPVPFETIIFPLTFYPGTDLAEKAEREGLTVLGGAESERVRCHGFRQTFTNRIFFLLDRCAREGVRIWTWEMAVLTSPCLQRLGFSQWWLWRIEDRLNRLSKPQAAERVPENGTSGIDFSAGEFAGQLGAGWHAREQAGGGFRWTAQQCTFYLFPSGNERTIALEGAVPEIARYGRSLELKIYQGRRRIHREVFTRSGAFSLRAPLASDEDSQHAVQAFQIRLSRAFSPPRLGLNADLRRLGIVVRSARLE